MEVDEDDDFYAPEESLPSGNYQPEQKPVVKSEQEEDLEEGEEEDEEGEDEDDSVLYVVSIWYETWRADQAIGYRHYHREEGWYQGSATIVSEG